MKKSTVKKFAGRLLGLAAGANIILFLIFFFDLDGKLLYYVVEPLLCRHYDSLQRRDTLKTPYDTDKYPSYEYNIQGNH